MKYGQPADRIQSEEQFFLKNQTKNIMEKLVPDPSLKNQN